MEPLVSRRRSHRVGLQVPVRITLGYETLETTTLLVSRRGALVRHPSEPEWGLGQVQSVIGPRVTVNFQGAGKVLINADRVALIVVESAEGMS